MQKNNPSKTFLCDFAEESYTELRPSLFLALATGFIFWVSLLGILVWIAMSSL